MNMPSLLQQNVTAVSLNRYVNYCNCNMKIINLTKMLHIFYNYTHAKIYAPSLVFTYVHSISYYNIIHFTLHVVIILCHICYIIQGGTEKTSQPLLCHITATVHHN